MTQKSRQISVPLPELERQRDVFEKLIELVEILRGPQGCPWDREQTLETLKPMWIEEAYEVLEALDGDNAGELCEELGDVLFHIVFFSQIAAEQGDFDAREVCCRAYEKMVRRHPHVFGDTTFKDSKDLLRNWEEIKAAEQQAAGREPGMSSLLEGISPALPALYTTYQMTSKAARVGFDWPDLKELRKKVLEELDEVHSALRANDGDQLKEEVGDLLFAAVNVARFLEIDPETALRSANRKFARRFMEMEKRFAAQGKPLKELTLAEMEAAWQELKQDPAERGNWQ